MRAEADAGLRQKENNRLSVQRRVARLVTAVQQAAAVGEPGQSPSATAGGAGTRLAVSGELTTIVAAISLAAFNGGGGGQSSGVQELADMDSGLRAEAAKTAAHIGADIGDGVSAANSNY